MIEGMRLKAILKEQMKRKGITASQLARSADVPKQSISDWLAGTPPRDITRVKRVAEALGLSLDQLCFGGVAPEAGVKTTLLDDGGIDPKDPVLKSLSQLFSIVDDGSIGGVLEIRLRRPVK